MVAEKPEAPRKPILSSVDETQISIVIPQSSDDLGSPVLTYSLFINEGIDGSDFYEVTDYDGISQTYQFNSGDIVGSFTLVTGRIYRIKTVASNSIDTSEDSEELLVGLA